MMGFLAQHVLAPIGMHGAKAPAPLALLAPFAQPEGIEARMLLVVSRYVMRCDTFGKIVAPGIALMPPSIFSDLCSLILERHRETFLKTRHVSQ